MADEWGEIKPKLTRMLQVHEHPNVPDSLCSDKVIMQKTTYQTERKCIDLSAFSRPSTASASSI